MREDGTLTAIDGAAMLRQVEAWSAINTGTANLAGLASQAAALAEAFAVLPGTVELVDPAPVTAIAADGSAFDKPHGQHLVVRVRPQANRRILLTGHMDTVFPADHAFQRLRWLDGETLNGPGVADMKGGIAIMLHALMAFEQTSAASALGYDVLINSDEETGSLSSAPLIAALAQGKAAALTYPDTSLLDGLGRPVREQSGRLRAFLRLLTAALLVIALAGPRTANKEIERETDGLDIMMVVDLSWSMMALDMSTPRAEVTRWQASQSVIYDFLSKRPDDRIGAVVFSGKPYLLSPLTINKIWVEKGIDRMHIGIIQETGTAIGEAVVTVTGVGGATVGKALERKEATDDAAKPSASLAVKRKLSAPPGEGAVKLACSAVSLASVTAGPLTCCQR